jgi:hypothetical protein
VSITINSGSQAATVGTEHTLLDVSAIGSYLLSVDLTPMAANDIVELRVKKLFKSAGSLVVVYYDFWTDAQIADDAGKVGVPVVCAFTTSPSLRFTLKQTAGTSRTFDWLVEQLG